MKLGKLAVWTMLDQLSAAQTRDIAAAIEVARSAPQVFESTTVFDLSDLSDAIDAVSVPAKRGNVLLSF